MNQIKNDATAQNNTDYRDGAFVSIFFASAGAAAANDQRVTSTFIGIYPCGENMMMEKVENAVKQ